MVFLRPLLYSNQLLYNSLLGEAINYIHNDSSVWLGLKCWKEISPKNNILEPFTWSSEVNLNFTDYPEYLLYQIGSNIEN